MISNGSKDFIIKANVVEEYVGNYEGTIEIPEGVIRIAMGAFPPTWVRDYSKVTKIVFPRSLKCIPSGVCSMWNNLKEVVIPEGVTSIGAYAFSGYTSLTGVTIPKTLKSIGQNAFQKCTSLKNVYISDLAAWCSVDINGYDATPLSDGGSLYLNGEVIRDLVIPSNVTSISRYAFYGFTTLNSVTFHSRVTNIGACAFAHCIGITSITIPDSVTTIGEYAFYNCYNIKSFSMGVGVTSIGDYAFDKFKSLESLIYGGRVEQWNRIDKDNLWDGYVTTFSIRCTDGIIAKNGTVTYN